MPSASEVQPPEPAPVASADRWRVRAPELLTQALFTLVAVVLAFAAEEWREERELDRIAGEARASILQELAHNHEELLESRPDTEALLARLATRRDAAPQAAGGTGFELALLSSAAWRSAQTMDVSRRMDHAWMLQVARAHELQAMYEQAQSDAVEANMALQAAGDDPTRDAAERALLVRMRHLAKRSRSLEGDYADILR